MIIDFNKNRRSKKSNTPFYKNKIVLALFALLTVASFLFIDKPLALFFHSSVNFLQDPLLLISRLFSPFFALVLFPSLFFGIRFIAKNERKSRKFQFLSLSVALSLFTCQILAVFLGRSIPSWLFDHGEMTIRLFQWNPSFHSLPSAISCNIAAIGTGLSFLYPKRGLSFLAGGFLLALTPAFLTDCFLSDALIGISLGFTITLFVFQTVKKEISLT